jgi:hypothetical protein
LRQIEHCRGARDVLALSNRDEYPQLLQRHVFRLLRIGEPRG